ncbi:hypothetical protein [Nocardia sp. CC227C]|uniref:hypothetical protein n=1 Tax=Nocardia sp. CC227C TaxID=3044562 RepID=UPI00278BB25A|nr:hypothetical protein [Nocardia sp. CC227C]
MSAGDSQGVVFPLVDGVRSASSAGRAILAAAVRDADPGRAARIENAASWHTDYREHFVAATALGAHAPADTLRTAVAGLDAARRVLRYRIGAEETAIADRTWPDTVTHKAVTIHGDRQPGTVLSVPYGGTRLSGAALRDQLHRWHERGIVEYGFVTALERAIVDPSVLRVPGRQIALLGAAAALGPLEPLCEWGAQVLAVDVPTPAVADRIGEIARRGAGAVTVPHREGAAGMDVTAAVPEVTAWLLATAAADRDLVVGMYGYAHGARHVALTAAADAVAAQLMWLRPGTGVAYLSTPTDAYLVPDRVVDHARRGWAARGRIMRVVQGGLRLASGGELCRRGYSTEHAAADGTRWGVADLLLPMQGPNYALAKRIQRWRGLVAAADGNPVSLSVAPASWTRSVTANRVFRYAYAGASRFGVEVFDARTTRYLMAAKLAVDLADPVPPTEHPEALLYADANHGGFWRQPFDPKSVLPLAALFGALGTRRDQTRARMNL